MSKDPRIRSPREPAATEILLLKAILAELVRLRQMLEDEVGDGDMRQPRGSRWRPAGQGDGD
jgi:hypothetical protein